MVNDIFGRVNDINKSRVIQDSMGNSELVKFQLKILTTNGSKSFSAENIKINNYYTKLPFFSITKNLRPFAQHEALKMGRAA